MKTVRFAILGCGKAAAKHAAALGQVQHAKLQAVCDVDKTRAEKMGKENKCKYYYDIDELLKDPEVDFVSICTPSGMHKEHAIQFLNAGKNVLCEKPAALKESDVLAMARAAEENKKLLFVVKQNRHNPPVKLVVRLVNEGKLGKPLMCVVDMVWSRGQDYYDSDLWRGTLELEGGTISSQASHFADLMLMFTGKPKTIFALMNKQRHKIEIEDTGIIAVEFENGALGSLNYTTCATGGKNVEGSITLVFEKGTIKIDGAYLNEVEYFHVEGVDSYELEESTAGPNEYGTYQGSMSNHAQVIKDMVTKFNDPESVVITPAVKDTAMLARFFEKTLLSAKKGEKVHF